MSAQLVELIQEMNHLLWSQAKHTSSAGPKTPIFVVSLPRAGSTIFTQFLIWRLRLGYVTNLISRFWMAPSYGIALARHLSQDPGAHLNDTSTFGATDGYEGHHEFGYFWRRWFHYTTSHHIDQSRWGDIDVNEMRHVLKRMEATWERPLIFKNPPALSMQVHFFDTHLNDPLFIYVTRSDQDVAFSLRRAREQVLKSPDKWFSTKPPNYEELRALPQVRQIAAQVVFTRREIERQLSCVDQDRIHILQYETLLRTPLAAMENVIDWLSFHIPHLERRSVDISKLVPISPSSRAIDETTRQQLTEALDALS